MTVISIPFIYFLLFILCIILHYVLADYLLLCVSLPLCLIISFFLSPFCTLSFLLNLYIPLTLTHTNTHAQSFLQQCSLKPCSTHPQQAATSSDQVPSLWFIHSFTLLHNLPLLHFVISLFYYFLLHDLISCRIAPITLHTVWQHSNVNIIYSYLYHISFFSIFQLKFLDWSTVNGGFSFTVELSRPGDSLSCIAALSTSVVMVSQSASQSANEPFNPTRNIALNFF